MKKKLKSGKGTTIVEMLVALILLSLLTAGGVAATSAVMTDYNHMSEAARADILASTVIETINNEIRLGRDLTVDPSNTSELRLDSAYVGVDSCIRLDDNYKLVAEVETAPAAGGAPATKELKQLLSEKTYGGLWLDNLTFVKVEEGGTLTEPNIDPLGKSVFIVSFEVKSEYGGVTAAPLWSGSVAVAPLSR